MELSLALLMAALVLLHTFQSLFTRLFSIHYAGGDEGISTSIFAICFGAIIGSITLISRGFVYQPAWQTLFFGLGNALMLWLYNVSLIQAGNRGSYAFLIIAAMFGGIIMPLFVDVLFMGESLTPLQSGAIGLMLFSLVVMNCKGLSLKGASGTYYLWCGLLFLANGAFSALMNLQEGMMGSSQSGEMIVTTYLGTALLASLFHLVRGQGRRLISGFRMGKKAALFTLGSSGVAALASNLLLYLLGQMNASILFTIDTGGVLVISALCSCLAFKEKLRIHQVIGIGLATVSIILINL